MINEIRAFLDCNNHLRKNIDTLKEAFIKYYKEEKTEEVESKFQKALLIAYHNPSTIPRTIREIAKLYTKELIESLIKETNIDLTQEDLLETFTLDSPNVLPLMKFHRFFEKHKLGKEGRKRSFEKTPITTSQEY